MRRIAPRQNRRRKQDAVSVSLFPFLAVLICTMGALIVLLVVIARQARLQAAEAKGAEDAEVRGDLETELELAQWRAEQLRIAREKTESQLADARLVLGHIEDHARRLRDELARLEAAWNKLQHFEHHDSRRRAQMEAELSRVRSEIAQTERRLADARKAAHQRRRSYAVVPYQGPHGTYRRPIYIECRAEDIILQPEGVVLTETDFQGPMGPGNPLAAALRAAREYLLAQQSFDPRKSGEPYPLLLVRPNGIVAYYAARAAMKSWGSQFGYELIGDDWELSFQPRDPALAQVLRRAVESARLRQRLLAAAARRSGAKPGRPEYTVSPGRGGVVRADGLPAGAGSGYLGRGRSTAFGRQSSPERSRQNPTPGPDRTGREDTRQAATRPEGTIAGRPPSERDSSVVPGGTPLRPGQWRPGEASPDDRPAAGQSDRDIQSLAASRGQGWGLPDAVQGSVPFRRSIRIDCYRDRLVILPEKGVAGGRAVQLGPRTDDSVDELIAAVWQRMDSWGVAGKNMYWRPVLELRVTPAAQQRFAELRMLLDESGLIVEKKD